MLRAHMNVGPVDGTLQGGPEALNPVHRRAAKADILARAVVYRHMSVALQVKPGVAREFVGMHRAARHDVGLYERLERSPAHVLNDLGLHIAATFIHAENDGLANCATTALAALPLAADVSLVYLDGGIQAAQGSVTVDDAHVLPDFVAHTPRGFVGDANLPLDLLGGDPVPRSAELEHDEKPVAQGRAGPLEWRARCRVYLMRAPLAFV